MFDGVQRCKCRSGVDQTGSRDGEYGDWVTGRQGDTERG
jgi:hypothetical protein